MTTFQSTVPLGGKVTNKVIKGEVDAPLSWKVRNAVRPSYIQGWVGAKAAKVVSSMLPVSTMVSELRLRKYDTQKNQWVNYGIVGRKVVTDIGVETIVDAFQGNFTLTTYIQHGTGSGSAAEAAADVDLETPHTTELNPDNVRGLGTNTESAQNIYRTVGTNTYDATVIVREHGIFNQTDPSGGSLLDRTVFAEINLSSGDSLQSTYDLTFTAGS